MKFLKLITDEKITYLNIDSIVCIQESTYEKGAIIYFNNGEMATNETAEELIKGINNLEKQNEWEIDTDETDKVGE